MTKIDRLRIALSFSLPSLALAAFLLLPNPAMAQLEGEGDPTPNPCSCMYNGQCYSSGACVGSVCNANQGQRCTNGSWGSCALCN